MSTIASARLLIGRTITGFEARPFPDGRHGTAHRPVVELDNGATLTFTVEETEDPVHPYGVAIVYHPGS